MPASCQRRRRDEAGDQTAGRDLEGVRRTAVIRLREFLLFRASCRGRLLRSKADGGLAEDTKRDRRGLTIREMGADKTGAVLAFGGGSLEVDPRRHMGTGRGIVRMRSQNVDRRRELRPEGNEDEQSSETLLEVDRASHGLHHL